MQALKIVQGPHTLLAHHGKPAGSHTGETIYEDSGLLNSVENQIFEEQI